MHSAGVFEVMSMDESVGRFKWRITERLSDGRFSIETQGGINVDKIKPFLSEQFLKNVVWSSHRGIFYGDSISSKNAKTNNILDAVNNELHINLQDFKEVATTRITKERLNEQVQPAVYKYHPRLGGLVNQKDKPIVEFVFNTSGSAFKEELDTRDVPIYDEVSGNVHSVSVSAASSNLNLILSDKKSGSKILQIDLNSKDAKDFLIALSGLDFQDPVNIKFKQNNEGEISFLVLNPKNNSKYQSVISEDDVRDEKDFLDLIEKFSEKLNTQKREHELFALSHSL